MDPCLAVCFAPGSGSGSGAGLRMCGGGLNSAGYFFFFLEHRGFFSTTDWKFSSKSQRSSGQLPKQASRGFRYDGLYVFLFVAVVVAVVVFFGVMRPKRILATLPACKTGFGSRHSLCFLFVMVKIASSCH